MNGFFSHKEELSLFLKCDAFRDFFALETGTCMTTSAEVDMFGCNNSAMHVYKTNVLFFRHDSSSGRKGLDGTVNKNFMEVWKV